MSEENLMRTKIVEIKEFSTVKSMVVSACIVVFTQIFTAYYRVTWCSARKQNSQKWFKAPFKCYSRFY